MAKKKHIPIPRLRNWRCFEVYHVYQRGNYKQPVFFTSTDLLSYLKRIDLLATRYSIRLHAFCLMSNHVHFLLETTRKDGISRFMQQLQSYHSRWIHSNQQRDGHLWKNRFGAKQITSSRHYHKALLYVERNPLTAGLVKRPEDYLYSSAAAHVAQLDVAVIGCGDEQVNVHLYVDRWRAECDPATWSVALEDPARAAMDQDLAEVRKVLGKDRQMPLNATSLPPPPLLAKTAAS